MTLLIILLIFTLFVTIFIAIQFPAVQTRIVHKATKYLSKELNHEVHIDGIEIDWFDRIRIKHFKVEDIYKNQMIYVDEAIIDFEVNSVKNLDISIQELILKNGRVKLIRFKPDGDLNIDELIAAIRNLSSDTSSTEASPPILVQKISLENMAFSYYDQRKPIEKSGFDHFHFHIDSINADADHLKIHADTFAINVSELTGIEKQSQLRIKDLKTEYLITKDKMEFAKLYAHIGNSYVKNYLLFEYDNINDLSNFNELTEVTAHLEKSLLDFKDLSNFAPALLPYKERPEISGDFKGKVIKFGVKNLDLKFGRQSRLLGKADFDGLPDLDEAFIDLRLKKSIVEAKDLSQYIDKSSYAVLKKFGKMSGNGEFIGFLSDFVANGTFNSDLGKVQSDINLKIPQDPNSTATYSGKLKTTDFNLGAILEKSYVGLIDMDGSIKGHGFSLDKAELKLDAKISRVGINKYNYKNIVTNATLSNKLFNGEISAKDSNLVFSASGKVDFRNEKEIFNIKANFTKANLKPLNLSPVETLVKTDVSLDFEGLNPDEIEGNIIFSNTYLLYKNNKEIFIDFLHARSLKYDDQRTFNVISDLVTVSSKGNFEFTQLKKDIETLYYEYALDLENNQSKIAAYYKNKDVKNISDYDLDFNINVKNLNALFSIYLPGLYLSKDSKITGNFKNGYTSILNFQTQFDTLYYNEYELLNASVDISGSKLADSTNILAMAYLNSEKQKFKNIPETRNWQLEAVWSNRNIKFFNRIYQSKSNNNLLLNGNLSFHVDNTILITSTNSYINILNKHWAVSDLTKIIFKDKDLVFKDVNISNFSQSLTLNGRLTNENTSDKATLTLSSFQLSNLNPLLPDFKLAGLFDGEVVFKDIYKNLNIDGIANIKDFGIDNVQIGNISGNCSYDDSNNKLSLDVDVERLEHTVASLKGYIETDYEQNKHEANLTAYLNNTELQILQPLLKDYVSDISGKASGTFKLTGPLNSMKYKGRADVRNGKFKINYLGTTYRFDDFVYFDDNLIGFKGLRLKDPQGNSALLDGGFYHDNFNNFIVNIKTNLTNFQTLDLKETDNDMFFGIGYATGDMEILGTFADLEIKANATTNKGTKIYIPLNKSSSLEKQEYISFISKKDKEELENKKIDLSGIKLDFNLNITPDAYTEIIFDQRTGDIIKGNGNGNIRMEIDTRGDFHLYGNYYIEKGTYNFTLAGLINKEFTIQSGSAISWTGDPYGGNLKIKASYDQFVTLKPIISDSIVANTEGLRRYPVKTILGVDGNLLSPDISLDIKITGYPSSLAQHVTEFESDIQSNVNELNRQVFSLIVLNSLSSKSFNGISHPGGNLSEMLSHQLSTWLSQVDENLQIDLNLNTLDLDAFNNFRLRLSYTMLDGRLRITRDGNISTAQQPQTTGNNNLSNITGEWTVEYLLNEDGRFRLKLYNKNNQNQLLTSLTNTNTTTAGFSLMHTQSFNSLKDLLGSKRSKKNIDPNTEKEFLKKLDRIQKQIEERENKFKKDNEEQENRTSGKTSYKVDLLRPEDNDEEE